MKFAQRRLRHSIKYDIIIVIICPPSCDVMVSRAGAQAQRQFADQRKMTLSIQFRLCGLYLRPIRHANLPSMNN